MAYTDSYCMTFVTGSPCRALDVTHYITHVSTSVPAHKSVSLVAWPGDWRSALEARGRIYTGTKQVLRKCWLNG